ncbi:hypothetical protein JTE90_011296 [Oedothorax gibbosus]|uniref:Uncharacterized protein n=1 Tax=Oedothorax gibbosus TaxID=931172 RepID=A0AAV6VN40_9ARAC|nr:hypothetical protein JTE90_011296 [Oedothorax gibbosus]
MSSISKPLAVGGVTPTSRAVCVGRKRPQVSRAGDAAPQGSSSLAAPKHPFRRQKRCYDYYTANLLVNCFLYDT